MSYAEDGIIQFSFPTDSTKKHLFRYCKMYLHRRASESNLHSGEGCVKGFSESPLPACSVALE